MTDKRKRVEEDMNGTAAAQTLQTKSAAMSGILAAISSMSHEELMQWWPDAQALAANINPNAAAENAASIQMKPSAAVAGAVKEETQVLFDGESISEEAQGKISTLIENAVDVRVSIIREELEESYREKLVEEALKIQEDLIEKIDSYATYAAEQFVEKNQVAIESTIMVERAKRIVEGLTSLVAECDLTLTESEIDAMESLRLEKRELEDKLNEQLEESIALRRTVTAMSAMNIFNEVSEGLTPIETDRFKKLVEDVDVDIDHGDLREKLKIIREAHFKKSAKTSSTGLAEQMESTEGAPQSLTEENTKTEIEDPRIARYADAIKRASADRRYARGPYAR